MNKGDLLYKITNYEPENEQEERDKELMLKALNSFEDVITRDNVICHFTASTFIINKERTKVIFIYHNIYDSWAWVGGHADGDYDLLNVAIKEAKEETGVTNIRAVSNDIFTLQALTVDPHIKRGKYVSSHLHLDCCFLLEADEEELLKIKPDENSGVKWVKLNEVNELSNEKKMKPIYQKIVMKINRR